MASDQVSKYQQIWQIITHINTTNMRDNQINNVTNEYIKLEF